jgi:hypothetical protein
MFCQMEKTVIETENLNVAPHVVQFYGHDGELAERVTDSLLAEMGRLYDAVIGPDGPGAVRTFAYHRDSPAAARHFTAGTVREWGAGNAAGDLADDAALVVTELAANAIVHARSGFTVMLSTRGDRLRIAVRDASPQGTPLVPAPLHGLAAVDALACRWGVESLGEAGKTVWVELRR